MGGVIVLKARGELKYGEYQFSKQSSVADVVETITEAKVVQHAFTVPEGLTSEQIVARLLENEVLTGQIKEIPARGYVAAGNVPIYSGMTREQIIQRMQQAHRRVLQEVWERRVQDLPVKTRSNWSRLLRSWKRKPANRTSARGFGSAVFRQSNEDKMRLQSDPTIIYGLTGGKGSPGRPILE